LLVAFGDVAGDVAAPPDGPVDVELPETLCVITLVVGLTTVTVVPPAPMTVAPIGVGTAPAVGVAYAGARVTGAMPGAGPVEENHGSGVPVAVVVTCAYAGNTEATPSSAAHVATRDFMLQGEASAVPLPLAPPPDLWRAGLVP
jgi:hypothetical protein